MEGVEAGDGELLEEERQGAGRTGEERGVGGGEDGERSGGGEVGGDGGGGELLETERGEDCGEESWGIGVSRRVECGGGRRDGGGGAAV